MIESRGLQLGVGCGVWRVGRERVVGNALNPVRVLHKKMARVLAKNNVLALLSTSCFDL